MTENNQESIRNLKLSTLYTTLHHLGKRVVLLAENNQEPIRDTELPKLSRTWK